MMAVLTYLLNQLGSCIEINN